MIDIDMTNQVTRQKPLYQTTGFSPVMDGDIKAQTTKMQVGFATEMQKIAQAAAANAVPPDQAVMMQYHTLVTPYCMGVAQKMFAQF